MDDIWRREHSMSQRRRISSSVTFLLFFQIELNEIENKNVERAVASIFERPIVLSLRTSKIGLQT